MRKRLRSFVSLAVLAAASRMPADLRKRFETAEKLSDEDRAAMIAIARQALAALAAKPTP